VTVLFGLALRARGWGGSVREAALAPLPAIAGSAVVARGDPGLPGALAKEGGGGADGGDGGDDLFRLLGSPRDVLARAVGLIAAAEDLLMAPPVALPAHAAGRSS